MPKFIPPYMGEEVKSNAERKVFDALHDLELDNCFVLHSLGLPKHQGKIIGEADFVTISKRGVACLEIKGGRVECRDGLWIFTNRYGEENVKTEGPFAQGKGNAFALINELKKKFPNNPRIKNLLPAFGVVFPDIEYRATTGESIPEVVYDNTTKSITEYINGLFDYWYGRKRRESAELENFDIKNIVDFLRGDFTFIPALKNRLDAVENNLLRLTYGQARVMDGLSLNPRLLIEGGAGTGKTFLAADYAKKRAEKGDRVLYLTFNKNLANNIASQIDSPNIKVINIHALFGEYVKIDLVRMKEDPGKYFGEELPEAFFEYVNSLTEDELNSLKYDVLVIDEGQDVIKSLYLCCLDMLLKGGFEKGDWAIFYDEQQNIYNPDFVEGMEFIESISHCKFKLFVNCRNTVQIGTYCANLTGVDIHEFIQENGEEVQKISYTDLADFKQKLKDIIKFLRAGKIDLRDVTFLAPKTYANSVLSRIDFEVNELGDKFDPASKLPNFATIQGFKGLDSKIVILVDVEAIKPENFAKYMYIAGTRARTLLIVMGAESFWAKHKN